MAVKNQLFIDKIEKPFDEWKKLPENQINITEKAV